MKIAVLVKHVIDVELNIRVKEGQLVEDGMTYVLSRWDENALEGALTLKEAGEAEVTAISVGPDRVSESLRKALAMGADNAIHINDPATQGSDSLGYARILAKVVEDKGFDIVFAGRQSQDTDMGGTGAMLAALLDRPCISNVIHLESPADGRMVVHRNGDVGREVVDVALPVVLTANDSLNEPRLASLRGIMAAKKKPMDTLTLGDLGIDPASVGSAGAKTTVSEYLPPAARAAGQKLEGDAEEITREVAGLLINQAKIFG